jgi:hypothetical protein
MFQPDFIPQQVRMSLEVACNNLDLVFLPGPESFKDKFQPYTPAYQLLARSYGRHKYLRGELKNFSVIM